MQNNLINLTPHNVVIYDSEGLVKLKIESSGTIRVNFTTKAMGGYYGIPLVSKPNFNGFDDDAKKLLADYHDKDIIVSSIAAEELTRSGLFNGSIFVPDTTPDSVVRNSDGVIIGVTNLILYQ